MGQDDRNWMWDLRSGDGGMNGLEFTRSLTAGGLTQVLVHAAPSKLSIEVRTDDGETVAAAELERQGDYSPMTLLRLDGGRLTREEVWPDESLDGTAVLLAGGEVGVLTAWRHGPDHDWWQWSVEFSNHKERPANWRPEGGALRR
jgi:hypothetical protein